MESDYRILHEWRCAAGLPHFLSIDSSTVVYSRFVQWLREYHKRGSIILMTNKADGRPVGYGLMYNVDVWDRWLYVATYVAPEFRTRAHFLEASAICLDYLFTRFPLRKILIEVYEFAGHLRTYFERRGWVIEGYTPRHGYHEGGYSGFSTLALYRDTWETRKSKRRSAAANEPTGPSDS